MYDGRYNVAPRMYRTHTELSKPTDSLTNGTSTFMLIDTEREKEIALGVDWPFAQLGPGECVLSLAFKDQLDLKEGDQLDISLLIPILENVLSQQIYNKIAK